MRRTSVYIIEGQVTTCRPVRRRCPLIPHASSNRLSQEVLITSKTILMYEREHKPFSIGYTGDVVLTYLLFT